MRRFEYLAALIKERKYKNMVQVGTGKGPLSQYLLKHLPHLKLIEVAFYPGDYNLQDCMQKHKRKWEKRIQPYLNRVTVLEGPSAEMCNFVSDASVDLVFIDANHSYENCKEDILSWLPKVREGGILSGHDCQHPRFPGVQKAVGAVVHVHCPLIWLHSEQLEMPATPQNIPYGTPEMARAVDRLCHEITQNEQAPVFVMKGHVDGVVSYGADLESAVMALLNVYHQALFL